MFGVVLVCKFFAFDHELGAQFANELLRPFLQKNGAVNLMVRYSIPVFFGSANKKSPTVAWSVAVKGDKVTLSAHNTGDRRLRISALSLKDANGRSISLGSGLAGYALGQSTKNWTVPAHGFAAHGAASISAQSDGGPIQAVASIGK